MSEHSFRESYNNHLRSISVGAFLVASAAHGVEPHQDSVAIEDPLIDARVATQQIIENPDPYIWHMRGYADAVYGGDRLETVDEQAERLDTVILEDLFLAELTAVVDAPEDMELAAMHDLKERKKPELFAKLQDLAQEHYGIEISFRTQTVAIKVAMKSLDKGYPLAGATSLDSMEVSTIYDMASSLSSIPKSYLSAIGLERIHIYQSISNEDNYGVAGYTNGNGTINVAVDANGDVLRHEIGHDLDRKMRGSRSTESPIFDSIAQSQLTGEGLHPITSNEAYDRVYAEELNGIRARLNAETERSNEMRTIEERASCEVASRHPTDAQSIRHLQEEPSNGSEHKADMLRAILGGELREMLDPCKPRLYELTSELLAQLYVLDPKGTKWLIASSVAENRAFEGWTGTHEPKTMPDFPGTLRLPEPDQPYQP